MNFNKITLAALMALLYAACTDENGSLGAMGGAEQDQGMYAFVGQIGNIYPKLMRVADSANSEINPSEYEGSVFAAKGAKVTVYELDSLTLEKTGRSFAGAVDNDSGRFAFESLALNSPYVLIETLDSCYTEGCRERGVFYENNSTLLESAMDTVDVPFYLQVQQAVVDLRNVKKVSVSTLTTLKIPLLQKYFAEGKSFAEASELAECEILENFGIYENLGSFENLMGENSELAFVNELVRMDLLDVYRDFLTTSPMIVYAIPPKLFVGQGETREQYYLNSKKMIDYKIGYLARSKGLDRCTDARENETGVVKGPIDDDDVAVVCRSGKWTLGFKTIEHTVGSMTDTRDGKTYKTVTYNWGDVTQTWMAENLDFVDTTSLSVDSSLRANLSGNVYCYREEFDDANCSIYGREYQWSAAMNIGADDIKMYSVDSLGDTTYFAGPESSEGYSEKSWTWNYTDYITPSNHNAYQGVCPDGWRIPTFEDWKTMLQNMGAQYGVEQNDVLPALYDAAATGFDLKGWVKASIADDVRFVYLETFMYTNEFILADVPLYKLEVFNWRPYGFGLGLSDKHGFVKRVEGGEYDFSPYAPKTSAAVRCIKN